MPARTQPWLRGRSRSWSELWHGGAFAGRGADPMDLLSALGGGEIAVLAGVVLGAARSGAAVVLDGLAASVPALIAVEVEPAVAAHLVAGQRSREAGHQPVLQALGLEPVLDLRLRAGEGAGRPWRSRSSERHGGSGVGRQDRTS